MTETTAEWDLEKIREYWTEQVRKHCEMPQASWSDIWAMRLEMREIAKHIGSGINVLDVGCANGYTTVRLHEQTGAHFIGIDHSPEMIKVAQLCATSCNPYKISFEIGDICNLRFSDGNFDVVVSIRTLINLHDAERQIIAIKECLRVLKPGGLFLASEATFTGLDKLNKLRMEFGLLPLPMPPFNFYMTERTFEDAINGIAKIEVVVDFASGYYLGTRFLKPLLIEFTRPRSIYARRFIADPDTEFNRLCFMLPPVGDYGIQKLFIIRKL